MRDNPFDPRNRQRRFGDPDLTRRILERTSGRACARAERSLAGRWDRDLEPVDAQLLAGHLERCAACRSLSLIHERLPAVLMQLSEREPGPAFTAAVLAATCGQQPAACRQGFPDARTSGPSAGLERWAVRLRERLERAWERPRIAFEAAWVATALVSLLVWSPLTPESAPDQVGRIVQAGAGALPELVAGAGRQVDATVSGAGKFLGSAIAWVDARLNDVQLFLGPTEDLQPEDTNGARAPVRGL